MDDQNLRVEVELSKIVIRERSPEQYIYLQELDGDRTFPIVIGIFEAMAINREIRGEEPQRPMTHDLLSSIIDTLGARLEEVVVNDLRDDTFHASLIIHSNGDVMEVDARPSDAIALAVRQKSRIFVAESVFDRVGGGVGREGLEEGG